MSADKKPIRRSGELNIQSWQLPDLHGPTVHEYDALGNRSDRDARMRRARNPADPADAEDPEAAPEPEPEPEYEPPTAAELQALRAAAREEGFAEGREAGYDDGYATGHEAGLAAGREAGEQEGHATGMEKAAAEAELTLTAEKQVLAHQLGTAIEHLNQHEKTLEDELAPLARDLILRLTQGLLVQSLQQTPEQIEGIVHQAIELMPAAHERMEVLLHPDDASLLRSLDLHWLKNVDIRADESVSPGGCKVKTRHSLLDYTLDHRFQVQIQALLDNELTGPEEALRTLSRERFNELLELSAQARQREAEAADGEPEPEASAESADSREQEPTEAPAEEPAGAPAEDTAEPRPPETEAETADHALADAAEDGNKERDKDKQSTADGQQSATASDATDAHDEDDNAQPQ